MLSASPHRWPISHMACPATTFRSILNPKPLKDAPKAAANQDHVKLWADNPKPYTLPPPVPTCTDALRSLQTSTTSSWGRRTPKSPPPLPSLLFSPPGRMP